MYDYVAVLSIRVPNFGLEDSIFVLFSKYLMIYVRVLHLALVYPSLFLFDGTPSLKLILVLHIWLG